MHVAAETLLYTLLFCALYAQVFLLVTFLEMRAVRARGTLCRSAARPSIAGKSSPIDLNPRVAIIVPCWNEERTLMGTLDSLLALEYPRDKLSIVIVDDGSTDGTNAAAERYRAHPQVALLSKENGGKYTALNLGIEHIGVSADLIGCLDADSFVAPSALREIVRVFTDPSIMAVTSLIKVVKPHTIMERVQSVEYITSGFLREVLGSINALFVTPGPFSIYRRDVFEKLGPYRAAHQTEDLEIAMRMHAHGMQIGNTLSALVYTRAPRTFRQLFRQRVRWHYGFLRNALDYRAMFLRPQFGHVALFGIPAAVASIIGSIIFFGYSIYDIARSLAHRALQWATVGLRFEFPPDFSWFFVPTAPKVLLSLVLVATFLIIVWQSRRAAEGRRGFPRYFLYFFALYGMIAPLWYARAIYNVIRARGGTWR
ncbi:MAG: glycosyltransferase [bacterium]|nr:glycosyltransferase [bacterium]MDZ4285131.1 glycosyltransferase [Patescibacteria group bacterium]